MPISIALVATLLSMFFVLARWRKSAIGSLLFGIAVLWISSLPAVGELLSWSLQHQHPPVPIEDIPAGDCIVVLGGALGSTDYPEVGIDLTEASDRIYQTARLFRAGKAKSVIVAAGNQPWELSSVPEAKLISDLLVEWGVTPAAIILDTLSKNTRENAVNAVLAMKRSGCASGLLVTSAMHMPRAVAAFRKAGVEMFPVPVDVMPAGTGMNSLASFIPQASALTTTSGAIREWIGIWVYRWRDWN